MTVGDGLVRLRAVQLGKQSALATAVSATRRVPWRGMPVYNPNRTDPEADVGSLDPAMAPYPAGPPEVTWGPTGDLSFDDAVIRLSAGLKGGVSSTGAGTAKTTTFQIASLTADPFDYWTLEAGDDQSASDGFQCFGGVIDTLEETMGEELGPWTISDSWIFAGANLATDRTGALVVDPDPAWVFGDDTQVKIDTVPGSIGITPIADALHGAVIRVSNALDKKRLSNGSNTRRQLAGYGRGTRVIEVILTFAKTTATMAEAATLDDDPVPARYIEVVTTSPVLAETATPHEYRRRGAFRLYERADVEVGGNAAIRLTYRAFYDSTLGYAYQARVISQYGLS